VPSVPSRSPASSAALVVGGALRAALAVVSPTSCPGCGADDVELCRACRDRLGAEPSTGVLPAGLAVTTALRYEHEVRGVVLAWKQGGRSRLSGALAAPFARSVRRAAGLAPVVPDLVVAVPPSAAGTRRRGWEPVPHLASRAGVPLAPGLLHVGGRSAQKGRDRVARARAGAALVARAGVVSGRRVLLVDDVVTTGATLLAARGALVGAGATVVGAACLAVVPLLASGSGGTVLAHAARLPGTIP